MRSPITNTFVELGPIERGVVTVTLAQQASLNALSMPLVRELSETIRSLEADDAVQAVVLTGAGRAFCAGWDLTQDDAFPTDAATWIQQFDEEHALFWQIWHTRLGFVAAVNGYCLGLGLDLSLVCDLTVGGETSQYGEPEVRFRGFPGFNLLPWMIGMKKARELLLTGERIDALEAHRIGLINHVAPDNELLATARRYAEKIAQLPGRSAGDYKAALAKHYDARGFRSTISQSSDDALLIALTEDHETAEFRRRVERDGVRQASAWLDEHRHGRMGPGHDAA